MRRLCGVLADTAKGAGAAMPVPMECGLKLTATAGGSPVNWNSWNDFHQTGVSASTAVRSRLAARGTNAK
jgi:hypothetical protein